MRNEAILLLMLTVVTATACGRTSEDSRAASQPPPAAVLVPLTSDNSLEQGLELLEADLETLITNQLEGGSSGALMRAEAITDRLLETRIDYTWIAEDRYLVDARIRQIQAEADRLVAQFQSGTARDTILSGANLLRTEVAELRAALAEHGAVAPPSLDELLEGDTLPQRVPG